MAGYFELANCTEFILSEIADAKITQKDVAMSYALAILSSEKTDWAKVNQAIRERWSGDSGLNRIKKAAWKIVEQKSEAVA